MTVPLKVLITGTNKGIGNELVKHFLSLSPNTQIYATSREPQEVAYERWRHLDKEKRVICLQLDVTQAHSVESFAKRVAKQGGKIDVLVNNAGVGKFSELHKPCPSYEYSRECFQINTFGPIHLTERLLPHLSDTVKVVNISSIYGALKIHSEQVQKIFTNPGLTHADIGAYVEQYLQEVKSGKMVKYNPIVYGATKMLLGAWSRFIFQGKLLKGKQLSICATPGLCFTPMTHDLPANLRAKAFTAENGALKIYQTIFLPNLDPNIFYHRARASDYQICGQGLPWE